MDSKTEGSDLFLAIVFEEFGRDTGISNPESLAPQASCLDA
jgi:hypothetical protein